MIVIFENYIYLCCLIKPLILEISLLLIQTIRTNSNTFSHLSVLAVEFFFSLSSPSHANHLISLHLPNVLNNCQPTILLFYYLAFLPSSHCHFHSRHSKINPSTFIFICLSLLVMLHTHFLLIHLFIRLYLQLSGNSELFSVGHNFSFNINIPVDNVCMYLIRLISVPYPSNSVWFLVYGSTVIDLK